MNTPRLGLLGCGVITQRILPGLTAILEDQGARVVAACDLDPSKVEAVARILGSDDLLRTESVETLLASEDVDGVLIATPIALHVSQVSQALAAGKHVYTHKTLADDAAGCLELENMAQSQGLRLAASPGQILLPAYARGRDIVQSGELGSIVSVDASAEAAPHRFETERADEDPPSGVPFSWEWYHREDRGGGPLQDMLVYPLAFLTELFGQTTAAAVQGRLTQPSIEWKGRSIEADALDAYSGVLRFGDIPVTVRSSFSSNSSRLSWGFIVIRGTRACLEIEKKNDREYRLHLHANGATPRTEVCDVWDIQEASRYGGAECHVLTDIREFVKALRAERPVRGATPANAARVAETISMMKSSAHRDGAWIQRGG